MLKIFTVFDSKAEAALAPFTTISTGTAVRSFEAAANEEGHDFKKYGADYTLFELGTFDEHTMKIELLPTPLNLGLAIACQVPTERVQLKEA